MLGRQSSQDVLGEDGEEERHRKENRQVKRENSYYRKSNRHCVKRNTRKFCICCQSIHPLLTGRAMIDDSFFSKRNIQLKVVLEGWKGKNCCIWQEWLAGWISRFCSQHRQNKNLTQRDVKEEKIIYKEMEKRKYIIRGLDAPFI